MLFTSTAGAGHFGPMEPVAQACVRRGHDVLVTAPDSFADHVQRSGLSFHPFPDVPSEQMGAVFARLPTLSTDEANRLVVGEIFGRLDAQAALPAMLELVGQWRPDVVVRDPAEFASLVAAARFGVPQAQVAIGLGSMLDLVSGVLDDPIRELERLAGVEPSEGESRVGATPTMSSVPARLDGTTAGPMWRFRAPVSASEPSLPGSFGDPDAPLVYVTFGSVTATIGLFGEVYQQAVRALSTMDVRVLLTTGTGYDLSRLGPLPANTLATQWWPQDSAMRETAVVVGHGGFGTMMSAAAAGVPQVVMPLFAADQYVNAERIEAAGAGRQLLGGPAQIDELPALIEEVLSERRYADAARQIAADIATLPDVSAMVDILEGLTA